MSISRKKGNLFNKKIFREVIKDKLRHWPSYSLLVLLNSSLLVFNAAINNSSKTFAPEEISSNQKLIYTSVKSDERELFPGATVAETNSSNTLPSVLPMKVRVKGYEEQLQEIISKGFNSQTLAITASNLDKPTALVVSNKQQLPQQQIANVTELDAQIHGLSTSSLAEQWSQIIRSLFIQAQQKGQPANVSHQLLLIGNTLLGMMLLCCLFLIWQKRFKAQEEQFKLQEPVLVVPQEEQLVTAMEQKTTAERQKNFNAPRRVLPPIGNVIVWLVGLTSIFYFWAVS